MRLYDNNSDTIVTLPQLKSEFLGFVADGSEDEPFVVYLYNVLEACLRGSNDCDIVDKKGEEISAYMDGLKSIFPPEYR